LLVLGQAEVEQIPLVAQGIILRCIFPATILIMTTSQGRYFLKHGVVGQVRLVEVEPINTAEAEVVVALVGLAPMGRHSQLPLVATLLFKVPLWVIH
jgi:hypothetical protein